MKKSILALAALSLTLCACQHHDEQTKAPEIVKVKTLCVAPTDVAGARVYSGTVEESNGTVISFPIAGTMTRILVDEGQFVSKGQTIAELDATNLRNAYEIAKSTTAQAQDAYDRMKMLHDANSLPDMQWVEVQNTLQQAKSAEAISKRALSDGVLRAPVSGYVLHKYAESGMTVAPAEPIIKIVTLDPIKISFSVPENDIANINKGQQANITVGALGDMTLSGKVTEKGIEANAITRAYDVKVSLPNPGNKLMPGMICDVTLEGATIDGVTSSQAIVLPNQAVLIDADNQNFVWVCQDGRAQRRAVKVDGLTDNGIIVSGSIAKGDSVIVEGQQKVSRGTLVKSIN